MIVYFGAKQPTSVADKNIFASDLPLCWITDTKKQSVFWRTKQNSSQIIPRISFIVHYELSAQHTVWMQCEIHVQYSGIQSFHVEGIHKIQTKLIRIMTFSKYLQESRPLFLSLGILNIYELNTYLMALFMHSYLCGNLPDTFENYFIQSKNIHLYNTRSAKNYT